MSDQDDAQIKAEIDGIMNGVKTIMQKIESLTPKEEPQQGQTEDESEKFHSSENNNTSEA